MAVDSVSISNRALTLLGAARISDLSEDSENARKVSAIYDDTLNAMLSEHNWNFAREERQLSLLDADSYPVLDTYASAFQLPSNCLRVIRMQDDVSFAIFSDRLYTNSDEAKIEYIKEETDASKYSPGFVKALASRIAADLAFSITQNATLAKGMEARAERDLKEAKWSDSQEGEGTHIVDGSFITQRQI